MKRAVLILSVLCVLAMLVACGNNTKKTRSLLKSIGQTTQSGAVQPNYEIPQIAFLMSVDYSPVREEEPLVTYVLYDQNGDVFYTDDSDIAHMTYAQILDKYQDGSFSDKLTKVKTIEDQGALQECIDNLQGILKNDEYKIIDPEYGPDFLSQTTWWQGLYYDENHELKSITLLMNDNFGDHVANDTRAGEIVEFLKSNCT